MTFTHDTYLSPFTWRYGSAEMRELWGETTRRKLWRSVWVALAQSESEVGLVTADQVAELRAHQNDIDIDRALQLEAELHHDLMAEIRTYAEQCPLAGGIIHLGATSQDILDNADALRFRLAFERIAYQLEAVLKLLTECILEWADVPTMAFTHIQPAEPTTVGYRMAMYAQDLWMDYEALQTVRANLRGKGIKGAVGTSASYAALLEGTTATPADLEARVMSLLGLDAFLIDGQTYPRKQDWLIGNALSGIAGSLYKFAFDLRLLQSLREWLEPFGAKQVGSSAMPFKRNPIKAENIDSLGRWVMAQTQVLWNNAAHSLLERTLDDSANRRSVLPEMFLAVEEMLLQTKGILTGLVINTDQIERNMAYYGPFAATEPLMMALVKAGADRQEMHERLREHSLHAWEMLTKEENNPLIEELAGDEHLTHFLTPDAIRATMDAKSHVGDAPQRARQLAQQIRAAF